VLEHDRAVDAGAVNGLAINRHRALIVGEQPGDDVEQRGFAATARSDDGDELTVADCERDVGQREDLAAVALDVVPLRQVIDVELVHAAR
jgi:hypothetical protein